MDSLDRARHELHAEQGQGDDYGEDAEELEEVVEVLHIGLSRIPRGLWARDSS